MDRVKITFVALLPALWLISSGQGFLDPCGNCASASAEDSSGVFQSGQHCPSSAAGTVDLSSLRANPRIGAHSPRIPISPFQLIGRSPALHRVASDNFSSQPQAALALAARWQFDFRAASEPRAPSLLS